MGYDLEFVIGKSYSQVINNNMGIYKIKKSDYLDTYNTSNNDFAFLSKNKDFAKFIDLSMNINNEKFLIILYNYLLRRSPDNEGYLNWKKFLDSGMSRQKVLDSFLNSEEFKKINQ